jgi:hypothetical protein
MNAVTTERDFSAEGYSVEWRVGCGWVGLTKAGEIIAADCTESGTWDALKRTVWLAEAIAKSRREEVDLCLGLGITPAVLASEKSDPIHEFFGLTYANYLVLPRAILQSLPLPTQRKLVQVLEEIRALYGDDFQPPAYRVLCLDERGKFITDPCPHYNKGRERIEPTQVKP